MPDEEGKDQTSGPFTRDPLRSTAVRRSRAFRESGSRTAQSTPLPVLTWDFRFGKRTVREPDELHATANPTAAAAVAWSSSLVTNTTSSSPARVGHSSKATARWMASSVRNRCSNTRL